MEGRSCAAASLLDVIVGAAFCPHPPVLVPDVAQGAAPELDALRSACRAAIRKVAPLAPRLVLLGSGPSSGAHAAGATGSFAGFGFPLEVSLGPTASGPVGLPLSLTVGAWLVRDALGPHPGVVGFSVGPDAAPVDDLGRAVTEQDAVLVVMGDGSARRSTAAPGYLDERAEPFDASVAAALAGGDGARLRSALPGAGPDLLAAGVPVWQVAADLLGGRTWDAELLYDAAPYGVGYFVATWT
jgi:hypothetical protein